MWIHEDEESRSAEKAKVVGFPRNGHWGGNWPTGSPTGKGKHRVDDSQQNQLEHELCVCLACADCGCERR